MKNVVRWLVIWACWTGVALFFASGEMLGQNEKIVPLGTVSIFTREFINDYLWFALTPLVLYLIRAFHIRRPDLYRNLGIHISCSILIAAAHLAVLTLIFQLAGLASDVGSVAEQFSTIFAANFHANIVYYWVIVVVSYTIGSNRLRLRPKDEEPSNSPTVKVESTVAAAPMLGHIPVKNSGRITLVDIDNIDWIEADDNYVRLYVAGKSHLVREKIGHLETRLEPEKFLRIHRSIIVNIRKIRELRPMPGGIFEVVLTGGRSVRSGRSYRERFALLLGE